MLAASLITMILSLIRHVRCASRFAHAHHLPNHWLIVLGQLSPPALRGLLDDMQDQLMIKLRVK